MDNGPSLGRRFDSLVKIGALTLQESVAIEALCLAFDTCTGDYSVQDMIAVVRETHGSFAVKGLYSLYDKNFEFPLYNQNRLHKALAEFYNVGEIDFDQFAGIRGLLWRFPYCLNEERSIGELCNEIATRYGDVGFQALKVFCANLAVCYEGVSDI